MHSVGRSLSLQFEHYHSIIMTCAVEEETITYSLPSAPEYSLTWKLLIILFGSSFFYLLLLFIYIFIIIFIHSVREY